MNKFDTYIYNDFLNEIAKEIVPGKMYMFNKDDCSIFEHDGSTFPNNIVSKISEIFPENIYFYGWFLKTVKEGKISGQIAIRPEGKHSEIIWDMEENRPYLKLSKYLNVKFESQTEALMMNADPISILENYGDSEFDAMADLLKKIEKTPAFEVDSNLVIHAVKIELQ
jgi:hypothetical protein